MLCFSDTEYERESQLKSWKSLPKFLATNAIFVFGSLHKWGKINTSLVSKIHRTKLPDSNTKPVSCQFKQAVCFFLFVIIQKKNK